eukprot:4957830-Pleurochrysis_carterae.AAC.2
MSTHRQTRLARKVGAKSTSNLTRAHTQSLSKRGRPAPDRADSSAQDRPPQKDETAALAASPPRGPSVRLAFGETREQQIQTAVRAARRRIRKGEIVELACLRPYMLAVGNRRVDSAHSGGRRPLGPVGAVLRPREAAARAPLRTHCPPPPHPPPLKAHLLPVQRARRTGRGPARIADSYRGWSRGGKESMLVVVLGAVQPMRLLLALIRLVPRRCT